MSRAPYFDQDTREDILDHISGHVFDRAQLATNDEPMRLKRYGECWHIDLAEREPIRRSVRR